MAGSPSLERDPDFVPLVRTNLIDVIRLLQSDPKLNSHIKSSFLRNKRDLSEIIPQQISEGNHKSPLCRISFARLSTVKEESLTIALNKRITNIKPTRQSLHVPREGRTLVTRP